MKLNLNDKIKLQIGELITNLLAAQTKIEELEAELAKRPPAEPEKHDA